MTTGINTYPTLMQMALLAFFAANAMTGSAGTPIMEVWEADTLAIDTLVAPDDTLAAPADTLADTLAVTLRASTTSDGDTWHALMPEFPYKSPEAAAFQRYGEHAMNQYNGTPSITIPLYSIEERDVTIPLTLAYDASGIRVSQEASWVGLGWNLMVGGCINYVTAGCRDKFIRSGTWANYLDIYWTSPDYRIFQSWPAETLSGPNDVYPDIAFGTGERDYYSASILGESFLFFWNPFTKEMEVMGNLRGKYTVASSPTVADDRFNGPIHSFTVSDNLGNTYLFGNAERSNDGSSEYVSAWNLTHITTASGETVSFEYGAECSMSDLHSLAESYTFQQGNENNSSYIGYGNPSMGFGHQVSFGSNTTGKRYLRSVTSRRTAVSFTTGPRDDYPGARRLEAVEVTDVATGRTLHRYVLEHAYTQSCTVGGDWLGWDGEDLTQPEARRSLRMALSAVHEVSASGDTLTHRLEYDPTPLPLKTSYARDLWGYYNGRENLNRSQPQITTLRTLVPTPSSVSGGLTGVMASFRGADRSASAAHARAGTLTRITYPTGGSTEIEYEPNVFYRNHGALPTVTDGQLLAGAAADTIGNATPSHSTSYSVARYNYELPATPADHALFTVTATEGARVSVLFTGDSPSALQDLKAAGAAVVLQRVGSQPVTLVNCTIGNGDDLTQQTLTKAFEVTLAPGDYVFNVTMGAVAGGRVCARGHLAFEDALDAVACLMDNASPIRGAGLRVRALTHRDADGSLSERREYAYAGGLMLVPEVYGAGYQRGHFVKPGSLEGRGYDLSTFCVSSYSQAKPSYLGSVAGGTVGYSKVLERRFGADGRLLRSIVSEYANREADAVAMYFYQFNVSGNGHLLGQREYGGDGACLRETANTYHDEIHDFVPCNIYQFDREIYPNASSPLGTNGGQYRLYNVVYSYPRRWSVLTSTVTTLHDGGAPYSESHAYAYDTLAMNVSTDEMATSADGRRMLTEYAYACGDSTACGAMTAAGYGGVRVGQSLSSLAGGGRRPLRSKTTAFAPVAVHAPENYLVRNAFLPVAVSYGVNGGVPEERMRYGYDNYGNLASAVKDGHDKAAFLWSYEAGFPVAEVRGATFEEVAGWLGTYTLRQLSAKANPTWADLEALRAALSPYPVEVATCLHLPGAGIIREKSPDGVTATYEYDAFNRLTTVKDSRGNTEANYDYHYKE